MDISIDSQALAGALKQLGKGSVTMTAQGETLALESESTTYRAAVRLECMVDTHGAESVTADAKTLLACLPKRKDESATIQATVEGLEVNGSLIALQTQVRLFESATGEASSVCTFDAEELSLALGVVASAAPKCDYRQVLNGVFLEVADGAADLVATDGCQMGHAAIRVRNGIDFSAIIPNDAVALLQRLLSFGEVACKQNGEHLEFVGASWRLAVHCVKGNYPKWRSVVPKETIHYLFLDRKALAEAIKAVLPMTQKKNSMVLLEFGPALTVSAESESGSTKRHVSLDHVVSNGLTVHFNGKWLLECLKRLDFNGASKSIVIEANDSSKPVLLLDATDRAQYQLLMPIKVTEAKGE